MARFCTRCGAAVTDQDQFCARCGSPAQGRSAQPALAVGQPQAAVHPPMSVPTLKRSDDTARAIATPPLGPQAPSGSRTLLSSILIVAARMLGMAVGLAVFNMIGSFGGDVDRNMALNTWSRYDTPARLHEHAVQVGRYGLVWGLILGGIWGWIKVARDRRRARR